MDEAQVNYARLEPGDEFKRIILRAVNLKNKEPLKLNGEYTLALRPDDAGNVARVQITQGSEFLFTCSRSLLFIFSLPRSLFPRRTDVAYYPPIRNGLPILVNKAGC